MCTFTPFFSLASRSFSISFAPLAFFSLRVSDRLFKVAFRKKLGKLGMGHPIERRKVTSTSAPQATPFLSSSPSGPSSLPCMRIDPQHAITKPTLLSSWCRALASSPHAKVVVLRPLLRRERRAGRRCRPYDSLVPKIGGQVIEGRGRHCSLPRRRRASAQGHAWRSEWRKIGQRHARAHAPLYGEPKRSSHVFELKAVAFSRGIRVPTVAQLAGVAIR